MRVTMNLPDDLFEGICRAAGERPVDEEIAGRLRRFLDVPLGERGVLISGKEREDLERVLGGLPLRDSKDVVERARKLASIEIGEVNVPFSISELNELQRRARKRGKTVHEVVAETVKRMHEQFFNQVRE